MHNCSLKGIERQVGYSSLVIICLGGVPVLLAFPWMMYVILAQLACPLNDIIVMFTSGVCNVDLC